MVNQITVLFRKATHRDVPEMTELLGALFSIESAFEICREKQQAGLTGMIDSPNNAVFVGVSDDRVVALCTIQELISTAEGGPCGLVEDVIVHGDFQGMGIGRRMMAHMVSWAASRGMSRLQLLADCDNKPALEFYSEIGWKPTGMKALRYKL